MFKAAGAKVIGLQDASGAVVNEAGIDIDAALDHVAAGGKLTEYTGVTTITEAEFWALKSDIFVPAALENQLTETRAKSISTRLVVEGANGPTTPAADDILHDRGILVAVSYTHLDVYKRQFMYWFIGSLNMPLSNHFA